ncbi:hypothetical protein EJ08DRAFT_669895 [Tothia fuscella]|uniref:ATP-grasp domain-containing protein n=1 Tax=Tothia fuscella TaxID=1048955 RepID=A0A9P4NTU6_9PEZI|nr:hypothetical protein EJ08DRAFT_669895 [Tothia fuscella]
MTKGLFLARTMYLGGCEVYGAEFKEPGNLVCGRFSRALRKFIPLKNPLVEGTEAYVSQVLEIIRTERIQLWISCSGVATASQDAQLARAIEKSTKCKTLQFDEDVITTLDDKLEFMQKTSQLKLANMQWYPLQHESDISGALNFINDSHSNFRRIRFMVKSANMDDSTRGSLPLLDSTDILAAEQLLKSLDYTGGRKWILQEFVDSGEEYCTFAVVIQGRVRAFTACASASVLMHYHQLDSKSILYGAMLKFTQDYANGLGRNATGHLSFDFLIRHISADGGFGGQLVPIECNPRCHTAVVLFEGMESALSEIYQEVIEGISETEILEAACEKETGFYWMAHDVVLGVSSFCSLLLSQDQLARSTALRQTLDCIYHLLSWRDPTFLWWDPLPWFVLNHLYWPWKLALASWAGMKWKQLNVSTTKMFKA